MKNAYTYNETYMMFVLGYDIMHDLLVNTDDEPCDSAMQVCEDVYSVFRDSIYNDTSKNEYECLERFVDHIRDLKFWLDNEYYNGTEYLAFKNQQVFELPLTYKEMAIALTLKAAYITTSDVDVAMAYAENGELL